MRPDRPSRREGEWHTGGQVSGKKEPVRRLAQELSAVADDLDHVLGRAAALHEEFMRQAGSEHGWNRLEETLTDELRHRRLRMIFLTADSLADLLRAESDAATQRFPEVDATGSRLPRIPAGEHPRRVAQWWADLPESDRELVVERLGHWCGRADGLPCRVRHGANTATLAEEIHLRATDIGDEIAAASGPGDGPIPRVGSVDDADERARRDLRGLLKLRALISPDEDEQRIPGSVVPAESLAALDEISTPWEQRSLYLLDARAYPLRTAVVLGDLERAHTVIVHVPGTTTTVDLRLYREAMWMSALREETGRVAGADRGGVDGVAVVDWIGYQAPYDIATRQALGNSGIRWLVPGEAIDDRYAREAAPLLVDCAEGLRAVIGPETRLVASGHSYGASVLGLALQQTDVFDACLVTGCPGLFTDDLSTLKVPSGQVYAAVATGDFIPRLGIFGPEVSKLAGVKALAPMPHLATYPDGGRVWTRLNMGHESYYDRGSSLLHDLASAAAGVEPPSRWPSWAT
ncbi:alpha/beta hydrolase [Austwickia chelonae]|uniref:alpha/beta hydrolase n=1 Tax=Austwickia chelonae TaxID=100225 RepID=UPI000E24ACCF|nr:alpha/beta hydrolase [Austwickia chelonae]